MAHRPKAGDRVGIGEDLGPGEGLIEMVQADAELRRQAGQAAAACAGVAVTVGFVLGKEHADVGTVAEAELTDGPERQLPRR